MNAQKYTLDSNYISRKSKTPLLLFR